MTCPKCYRDTLRTPSTFPYWICPKHGQVIPEIGPYTPEAECKRCQALNAQAKRLKEKLVKIQNIVREI